MAKKIIKKENQAIVELLLFGDVPKDHPWFWHPDYVIVPVVTRHKIDGAGQHVLVMNFKIEPRDQKWDTADSFQYIARIVYVLKSLTQCARVAVSYDTAYNSLTLKRHCTVAFDYVVSRQLAEKAVVQLERQERQAQKVLTGEIVRL